jgi:hypothetical protein
MPDSTVRVDLRGRVTKPAQVANKRNAALRAVDDPAKLARAARIVRAALLRQKLTLADLEGDIVQDVA